MSSVTQETKGQRQFCSGCRDDFYNHRATPGFDGATECWSLKTAETVTRYRLDWWTPPTVPGAFTKVQTNSCHHAPGRYALYKQLPDFAVGCER